MTDAEQSKAFVLELTAVVHRFRMEFSLTNAAAIGCLEMVKLSIFTEIMENDDED